MCPEQTVLGETDPARARRIGRAWLGRYLEMANYRNNLLRLGFGTIATVVAAGGVALACVRPERRVLLPLAAFTLVAALPR